MIEPRGLIWQQLHWPMPVELPHALGLLRRLASDQRRPPVVLEVRGREGKVSYLVGVPAVYSGEIASTIANLVPGVIVTTEGVERGTINRAAELTLSGTALTLAVDQPARAARTLLAALSAARFREETVVLQLLLGRGQQPRLQAPHPVDPTQSWWDVLANGVRPSSTEVTSSLRAKSAEPGVEAVIRVGVATASEGRGRTILEGILAALAVLDSPGVHVDFIRTPASAINEARTPWRWRLRLNSSELLNLTAWPLESPQLPGLPDPHPKPLRLTAKDVETKRIFATTTAPGTAKPIGISAADSLFHTLVQGNTGSGKSTVLLNLIVGDLEAGHSLVVIDPKRDLVIDALARTPTDRREDVVVLDPTDAIRPVGLNPFRSEGVPPEVIADGILNIFRQLYPNAFGPSTTDVTHAALLTLAQTPGATLTWLVPLLSDTAFRQRIITTMKDEALQAYWQQFEALSDRMRAQQVAPVLSRLRQFILRPSLRRVLDQPEPKFDLTELFAGDRPKALFVPLNAGILGRDGARLIGSLLVAKLFELTMARANTPSGQRTPLSIYVDELQEFVHIGDIENALAISRGLGVAWHFSLLYRELVNPTIRAALDANTKNKLFFALGPKDAHEVAQMAPGLEPDDFMALPSRSIYTTVMRHGSSLGWISGQTLPPPPTTSDPIELLATSQRRYGRDPEEHAATLPPNQPTAAPALGRRKRQQPSAGAPDAE